MTDDVRFIVRAATDGGYGAEYRSEVVDTKTGRILGSDGGEPEDQTLGRDWRWVVEELNRLDREAARPPADLVERPAPMADPALAALVARVRRQHHVHDKSCRGSYEPCGEHHRHTGPDDEYPCGGWSLRCAGAQVPDADKIALCDAIEAAGLTRALPDYRAMAIELLDGVAYDNANHPENLEESIAEIIRAFELVRAHPTPPAVGAPEKCARCGAAGPMEPVGAAWHCKSCNRYTFRDEVHTPPAVGVEVSEEERREVLRRVCDIPRARTPAASVNEACTARGVVALADALVLRDREVRRLREELAAEREVRNACARAFDGERSRADAAVRIDESRLRSLVGTLRTIATIPPSPRALCALAGDMEAALDGLTAEQQNERDARARLAQGDGGAKGGPDGSQEPDGGSDAG